LDDNSKVIRAIVCDVAKYLPDVIALQ